MNAFQDFLLKLIGPDGHATQLTLLQISLRGLIIFVVGIVMVRIGDRRSLSEKTAFDAIFIVLLGSMLSRAINGTGPFLATIAASTVLVLIHRGCAYGACRSHAFGKLLKGRDVLLVSNGRIDHAALRRHLVSEHDFEEDLRLQARTEDVAQIRTARLERSGDISFIKKER